MVAYFCSTQNVNNTGIEQILHTSLIYGKIRVDEITVVDDHLIRRLVIVIASLKVPLSEAHLLASVFLGQRHHSLLLNE